MRISLTLFANFFYLNQNNFFENNIPQLEKEKETLLNQLHDYEWRIEQETKVLSN